jgi:Tfp pilus assembly protein PilX
VLSRLRDESGIALVMSLLIMSVLTIVTGSVIFYTTSNQHSSQLTLSRDGAYRLAEAGINSAMSVLGNPPDLVTGIGNNALDKNVFCGLTGKTYVTGCTIREDYTTGYVVWSGSLLGATWTITSTGYVKNPNLHSSTGYAHRTLTATVNVHPTLTQKLNTPVWNYIYATKPASTPPTCDETLANSVSVASPFYVEGNLCLTQTSNIVSGPLVVKGRLNLANANQNWVGTSAKPLSDAHILNGCTLQSTTHTPCLKNANGSATGADNVWATVLDTTVPANLTPPVPDWENWYLNASPGPYFPCQTINGQAPLNPPVFDSGVTTDPSATDAQKWAYHDDSLDRTIGAQNLTPGYDYRCQTTGGELSWNNTTKTLTISGTVYIDGSAYVNNGSVNLYKGQGVIYLTGTLLMKSSSLCGAISSGACDLRPFQSSPAQGWDPNTNLLCFVAGGNGVQVGAQTGVNGGDGMELTSATLQGAAFATNNVELTTTSNIDGPIVANQVLLGQSVTTSFPSITIVPNSMPSNPTAYAQVDPPSGYSG